MQMEELQDPMERERQEIQILTHEDHQTRTIKLIMMSLNALLFFNLSKHIPHILEQEGMILTVMLIQLARR